MAPASRRRDPLGGPPRGGPPRDGRYGAGQRPAPRRSWAARIAAALALLLCAGALIAALGSFASRSRASSHAVRTRAVHTAVVARHMRRAPAVVAPTLPFAPPAQDRPIRANEVPSLYDDGLLCSTGCRPYDAVTGWPLKPFHRQHPLRAGLNELRPGSLHVGVDIQARDGAAVYAVAPGYAHILEASGPNARVQVGDYIYWHIDPSVIPGQYVTPFSTVLGTVMAGYGHIAFSELGWRGQYINPLRPGGTVLLPYSNTDPPVIGIPDLAAGGQVVVAAYSPQSFVRRTTYTTPVLAPAALAYRLYDRDGTPVTPLEWAFRGTQLLPWAERALIYAPGAGAPGYACFATRSVCVPHWVYRLAGGLAPPLPYALSPGAYRLTIYAWDWANNATALDTTVTMTPTGWKPIGHFPRSLFTAPDYFTEVGSVGTLPQGFSAGRSNATSGGEGVGRCCASSALSSPSASPTR